MKKIVYLIIILAVVGVIYFSFSSDRKIYYLSLGDSLAVGQNPYGGIGYGYSDYLADYLADNNKLEFYSKNFAHSGYRITDLANDINNNVAIDVDNKKLTIKHALVKANLITISIGANDLFYKLKINSVLEEVNHDEIIKYVDEIMLDLDSVLKLIRFYSKEELILVGYYNPLPKLTDIFDEVFVYVNKETLEITDKYDIKYIQVYDRFKNNLDYLPNPFDIHPGINGYKAISEEIIKHLSINK